MACRWEDAGRRSRSLKRRGAEQSEVVEAVFEAGREKGASGSRRGKLCQCACLPQILYRSLRSKCCLVLRSLGRTLRARFDLRMDRQTPSFLPGIACAGFILKPAKPSATWRYNARIRFICPDLRDPPAAPAWSAAKTLCSPSPRSHRQSSGAFNPWCWPEPLRPP